MTDPDPNIPHCPSLAAISIKLPPFWPADLEVWFAQIEAQFTTRGITSRKTRFDNVVSSLSPDLLSKLETSSLDQQTKLYTTT